MAFAPMLLAEEHFHRYLRMMKELDLKLQLAPVLEQLMQELAAMLQSKCNFVFDQPQMNIVEVHLQQT